MGLQYLDFDVQVEENAGREYQVQVLRSPAGEAQETTRLPYDELALQNRLLTLQNALLRSGGQRRSVPASEQLAVRDFGQALFDALMTGEVRSRYDVSLERARQAHKGLRLRLRFQSPFLAALPWEFMYDSREGEFICLTTNTPLVRYLDSPRPPQPLAVAPPLHVLGVAASPSDLPSLNVDNERQRIEVALQDLQQAGRLEITWLPDPSWQGIQRALRQKHWHIVHFIGHGSFDSLSGEGLIYLVNEQGKAQPFGATKFGRLLADQNSIRLVVLNACESAKGNDLDIFSSTASILVRRGLPAVLAMQYEITDQAAIVLSRAFYQALADNMPVDAAVAEARKAVSFAVNNTVEWGTPVLTMRATDGVLFEMAEQAVPVPAQAVAAAAVQPTEPVAETVFAVSRSDTQGASPAAAVGMQQRLPPAVQAISAPVADVAPPAAPARKRRWAVPVAMLTILLVLACAVLAQMGGGEPRPPAGDPPATSGAAAPQAGAVAALPANDTATPTARAVAAPTATNDTTPTPHPTPAAQQFADTATGSGPGRTGASYTRYHTITDDSGLISLEVPVEWRDVDGSPFEGLGTIGLRVRAAPDLFGFASGFDTPGVDIIAMDPHYTTEYLLDAWGVSFREFCVFGDRSPYNTSLYTGFLERWLGCGGGDTLVVAVGVEPYDGSFLAIVLVNIVSEADSEALDRIMNSFFVRVN